MELFSSSERELTNMDRERDDAADALEADHGSSKDEKRGLSVELRH